jgi:RNA polymerase subunit RPABC4/transcription elongation factor Spt4
VDEPKTPATTGSNEQGQADNDLPPGNHPLEVGARCGIGPLSALGREVWHGRTRPCVSCGQLVRREDAACRECGQDLSSPMLEKMRTHAGPWYVLEHVRPFPGVSLERIIRQIRRGLITETSIVRGPSTDHQWRFAVEAPGLCRYFGLCWNCHEQLSTSDTDCPRCQSYLSFEKPRTAPAAPPPPSTGGMGKRELARAMGTQDTGKPVSPKPPVIDPSPERKRRVEHSFEQVLPAEAHDHLMELSAVVDRTDLPAHEPVWDEPPRIAGIRATWVAVGVLAIFTVALIFFTRSRHEDLPRPDVTASPSVQTTP